MGVWEGVWDILFLRTPDSICCCYYISFIDIFFDVVCRCFIKHTRHMCHLGFVVIFFPITFLFIVLIYLFYFGFWLSGFCILLVFFFRVFFPSFFTCEFIKHSLATYYFSCRWGIRMVRSQFWCFVDMVFLAHKRISFFFFRLIFWRLYSYLCLSVTLALVFFSADFFFFAS